MTPDSEVRPELQVLVVDDSPSILDLIPRLLDGTEFSVVTACGGEAALETFHARRQTLRMVLTDIVMPGMDGNELAGQLRMLAPELPIAFMTGYTDQSREPGPCLDKPFTRERLVQFLRSALKVRRTRGAKAVR